MLPKVLQVKLPENNFPTAWQTVIFRNYGMVKNERICSVLGISEERLICEAIRLGLKSVNYNEKWEKSGYITIIRNNWQLLNYEQLLILLDFSEQKLDFILQNEDFLAVKLGSYKPRCEEIKYYPLNEKEIEKTNEIAKIIEEIILKEDRKVFDFFDGFKEEKIDDIKTEGIRLIHGYLTPCGDVFLEDDEKYMPDSLLLSYAKVGINAVWVHGLLSALSPYPFDENLSKDYKTRRYKLINLINRCKKYGIKVYLYLNEPRGIPKEKLGKFSHLAGREENGLVNLCIENLEVQDYLYNAVKDLFENVKGLGGVLTITMSENPTHCNYIPGNNCSNCKDIPAYVSASKVNNIIARAVKDGDKNAEVIANLWGWSQFMGWSEKETLKGIELLDKDISVLAVSEYDLDIEKGGVKSRIIDYSIGNPGPGEVAKNVLAYAKEKGHKIYAKIQINNSWECSAIPYIPAFDLTHEHLVNLRKIGVENYMLTWTLGGYPSPTMDMISKFNSLGDKFDLNEWYKGYFGKDGREVHKAVKLLCEGFREYPFSIESLYYSPKTLGLANLWDIESSEKSSLMVNYAFDDYKTWITPYPYDVYISQYQKLINKFEECVCILSKIANNQLIEELLVFSKVALSHFKSDKLQTEYSKAKEENDRDGIKKILVEEKEEVIKLLGVISYSQSIGFETSNHYFYTEKNLYEKLINLQRIEKQINPYKIES